MKPIILQYLKESEKKEKSAWIRSSLRVQVDFEKLSKNVAEARFVVLPFNFFLYADTFIFILARLVSVGNTLWLVCANWDLL